MATRHFTERVGAVVRLHTQFRVNGELFDPYAFPSDVSIFLVPTGGSAIAAIAPVKESTGVYYVEFTLTADNRFFDEWTWRAEQGMPPKVQRYSNEKLYVEGPTIFKTKDMVPVLT